MRAGFFKSILKNSCFVVLVALVILCLSACGDKGTKEPIETIPTENTYTEVKYFQYAPRVSVEKSSINDEVPINFFDKNGELLLGDLVEVSENDANFKAICTYYKTINAPVSYELTSLVHKGLIFVLEFEGNSEAKKISGYIADDSEKVISLELDRNSDGSISKIEMSDGSYREYIYDNNKNVTEVVISDKDGNITNRIKNEYDDNGNCLKVSSYNAHEIYTGGYEFKYDDNGNAIERISYNNYKNVTSKYAREFDERGNVIKNTDYNAKGEIIHINGYKYNSNRQKTEQIFYSVDGKVLNIERYEYDDRINLVKTSTYSDSNVLEFDVLNEYDENDVLVTVSTTVYFSDGSRDTVDIKDNEGRLLTHSRFYSDGEMWYQASYEYPSDNVYKETIFYPEFSNVDGRSTVIEKYPSGKTKQKTVYNKNGLLIEDIMYKDSLESEPIYEKHYRESGELQFCREYIDRPLPYKRLSKITHYHKNGAISNIAEYNALGKEVYSHYYRPDGSEGMEIYEYYDNGQLAYYSIGSFEGVVFESAYYDEDGTLYNKNINYEDGSTKYFEYNDFYFNSGNREYLMQKSVGVFDKDGTGTITYTNYDKDGNVISVEVVNQPVIN